VAKPKKRQLWNRYSEEARAGLRAGGWGQDVTRERSEGSRIVIAFRRGVDEQFELKVALRLFPPMPSDDMKVVPEFGISYRPAYRLWPVIDEGARMTDVLMNPEGRVKPTKWLASEGDVQVATEQLFALAEDAVAWAGRTATVDRLVEVLREAPEDLRQLKAIPLLFAAAGRADEAWTAVVRARESEGGLAHTAEFRRFALRLRRWMDSGQAAPDEEPVLVAPTPNDAPIGVGFQDVMSRQSQLQALHGDRKPRLTSAGRSLLERMEAKDVTHRTREFARISREMATQARYFYGEGPSLPNWLEPPLEACFPASRVVDKWITVELDVDIDVDATFERAIALAPPHRNQRSALELEAWLQEEAPGTGTPSFAVRVGEARVGRLPELAQHRFRRDYDVATSRGEYPVVVARLVQGDRGFLFEVSAPR
jgi:hypothetical protein